MTTAEPTQRPRGLGYLNGTMPALQERVVNIPIVGFIEYCLRGVAQVVFMNSPLTGLFIIVAAWTFDPWLGLGGTLGVIFSNLAALALGFDRGLIHAGLYGFNGVLVGLALATFLAPRWDPVIIVWIILISAMSSVLMAGFAATFLGSWGVPPFTLAFNISTVLFLVTALNLAFGRVGPLIEPISPSVRGPDVQIALRETAQAAGSTDAWAVLNAVFRGLGQLFFVNSILGGVLILVGILFCSRIAALFAFIGVIVGTLTGMALGADGVQIFNGLWGFNSYDACLAIAGVFYLLTWRTALLGVACAAVTALLFGAISSFFGPWGLPAMTLPFCFGTLAFVLIHTATKKFTYVRPADVTTPEEHLRRARASRQQSDSSPNTGETSSDTA